MFKILFSLLCSLVFAQAMQSTVQEINTLISQPYTAQEHFNDIKELLDSIKYTSPKNFTEFSTNRTIKEASKFLKSKLKENKESFFEGAIPFISIIIHRKDLIVPEQHRNNFVEKIERLIEKRNIALNHLQ